jgi:AbrB family looped-hinge helix DNA binding protein
MKRKRRLRLDREGRVRIPKRVLDKAKIRPGDSVEFEEVPGGVLLHPPAPPGLVWDRGRLVIEGPPLEDPLDAVRRCDREDEERLIRRCMGP